MTVHSYHGDCESVCVLNYSCIQCEEEQPGVIGDTHVITDMVEEVDLNNSTCSVKSADSFIGQSLHSCHDNACHRYVM